MSFLINTIILSAVGIIQVVKSTDGSKKTPEPLYKMSSFQIHQSLSKEQEYIISKKYPNQRYIHSSYFIEYRKRPRVELPDPQRGNDRFDGYPVFVVFGEMGIYVKKIQTRWLYITMDESKVAELMVPLLELGIDSTVKIVSAQMNGNETIFSVGYSNHTIQILEFVEDPSSVTVGYKLIQSAMFDLKYERLPSDDEDQGQIRSIGATPYSDFLIFSPNRFELFKLNRRTGVLEKKRALLDSTRHVICPVATFKHKDNPHYWNRTKRSWISDHNRKIGTATRCMLTGHDTPTNVVIDWTNMKPISFWNFGLMGGYPTDEDNTVHSITFFGGIPSASMYVFTTRRPENFVYLVSTVYSTRELHKYYDYQRAGSKVVNWVNGTLYVAIYIRDSTPSFPAGNQLAFIKVFGALTYRPFTESIRYRDGKGIKTYNQAKIFLEMGSETEESDSWDGMEDLDEYYLGFYILGNSLEVEGSILPWSYCKGVQAHRVSSSSSHTSLSQFTYGRHRTCHECLDGMDKINVDLIKMTNKTTVNCVLKYCSNTNNGKRRFRHVSETLINPDEIGERRIENEFTTDCDRYEVPELERHHANDNFCLPGFNRDPFGICRQCHSRVVAFPSNCLFFTPIATFREDYSLNLQNYTENKYNGQISFKGHRERVKISLKFSDGTKNLGLTHKNFYFHTDLIEGYTKLGATSRSTSTIWRDQRLPGSELCYRLSRKSNSVAGYSVQPAVGFVLKPMADYDWFDFRQQKLKFHQGPLNRMACIRTCKIGYYYDFESLSCRKCGIGCSQCRKFDECDLCTPGYSIVHLPKFRSLASHEVRGECIIGCQEGYYKKRFNGTCYECPRGCRFCRDRSILELEDLTPAERDKPETVGFCLICGGLGNEDGSMIADYLTGKCVQTCSGNGTVKVNKTTNMFRDQPKLKYDVCAFCEVEGCSLCLPDQLSGCLSCQSGLHLQQKENGRIACVKRDQLGNFSFLLISTTFLILIPLIFVFLFSVTMITKYLRNSRKDRLKRRRMKRKSTLRPSYVSRASRRITAMEEGETHMGRLRRLGARGLTGFSRVGEWGHGEPIEFDTNLVGALENDEIEKNGANKLLLKCIRRIQFLEGRVESAPTGLMEGENDDGTE